MAEIKVLKEVSLMQVIDETMSLLRVKFDDSSIAYMFEHSSVVNEYLDQEVIVSFRSEVIEGKIEKVVNTLARRAVVSTLDKNENIKLFTNNMPDIGSNVVFKNILNGQVVPNCIVYCDSVWTGASSKATWISLRVMDKKRNVIELKVFNADNTDIAMYAKKYLICDIIYSNGYYNTTHAAIKEDITVSANPEMVLARQYILNVIEDDKDLKEVVVSSGIIDRMELYSPIDFMAEAGAVSIQTAMELAMAHEMANLSKRVDVQFLKRLIVMSKMYVFTHVVGNPMSKELQSIMRSTMYKAVISKKLITAMEENPSKKQLERSLYDTISATVLPLVQSKYATGLLEADDLIWGKV